jgi:flavin-dependent dehydrogenase
MYRRWSVLRRYQSTLKYDAVIVGGGPSGLLLSLLLTEYNIPHALIEKRVHPTQHPQAHFINMRSMEIVYAHFPLIHRRVVEKSADSHTWR